MVRKDNFILIYSDLYILYFIIILIFFRPAPVILNATYANMFIWRYIEKEEFDPEFRHFASELVKKRAEISLFVPNPVLCTGRTNQWRRGIPGK